MSFATNDERTAKRVSDALGTATEMKAIRNYAGHRLSPWLGHLMVSRSETARPLLTPGEIMQLPPADEIVMVAGIPPIKAAKALTTGTLASGSNLAATRLSALRRCRLTVEFAASSANSRQVLAFRPAARTGRGHHRFRAAPSTQLGLAQPSSERPSRSPANSNSMATGR